MKVNQALCAAGPVDAVTGQALAYRALFDEWGWGGRDCADRTAGGIDRRTVRPLRTLEESPADALVLHYSGYAPHIERVLALPYPTLLVSHNITPARWFWRYQPTEGVHCTLGREQLAELAAAADVAAGVSEFNARELRAAGADASVIPILFDREALGAPGPQPPPGPPTILFVGRLAPHKRQDSVIRAFALYRRRHAPDARLVLVGVPAMPELDAALRRL
ncbi:MAG TPA: glycosyltransferase, partial [Solirubrobacteraceae bacterium]